MCAKEMAIDQFLLRSLPIIRVIKNLEKKEVIHILNQCKVLEHQTLVWKLLNN